MQMPSARLTSKGQATIPKEIRDHLKLQAGDIIDFVVDRDGVVVVRPGTAHVGQLKGILHKPGRRPVSLEEMDLAILGQHGRRR
jgi:antitoxin PrlF